jgi:hypothetical protein
MPRLKELNGNVKWIMTIISGLILFSVGGFTAWTANGIMRTEKIPELCEDVRQIKKRNTIRDEQWIRLEYYLREIGEKVGVKPYRNKE